MQVIGRVYTVFLVGRIPDTFLNFRNEKLNMCLNKHINRGCDIYSTAVIVGS